MGQIDLTYYEFDLYILKKFVPYLLNPILQKKDSFYRLTKYKKTIDFINFNKNINFQYKHLSKNIYIKINIFSY